MSALQPTIRALETSIAQIECGVVQTHLRDIKTQLENNNHNPGALVIHANLAGVYTLLTHSIEKFPQFSGQFQTVIEQAGKSIQQLRIMQRQRTPSDRLH